MFNLYIARGLTEVRAQPLVPPVVTVRGESYPDVVRAAEAVGLYAMCVHPEWGGCVVVALGPDGEVAAACRVPQPNWVPSNGQAQ